MWLVSLFTIHQNTEDFTQNIEEVTHVNVEIKEHDTKNIDENEEEYLNVKKESTIEEGKEVEKFNPHLITNNGVKRYSCKICNKNFTQKYTLKTLNRIKHEGIRLSCDLCNKVLQERHFRLKYHILKEHNSESWLVL